MRKIDQENLLPYMIDVHAVRMHNGETVPGKQTYPERIARPAVDNLHNLQGLIYFLCDWLVITFNRFHNPRPVFKRLDF
jgi:hypothetical protein